MLGKTKTTGRTRLVALGALLVVIAGAVAFKSLSTTSTGAAKPAAPVPPTTTPAPAPAPPPNPMEPAVKEVESFVEKTRGLTFVKPVKVTLADDLAFQTRLVGRRRPSKAEVDKVTGELRALGFVPPGFDLVKSATASMVAGIVGFYDFGSKELVVRGGQVTPYVKEVLAHELTHALDDQHFGLDRPALRQANDEAADSFQALSEGDAVRVQRAYRDAMSPADRASADAEDGRYGSLSDAAAPPPALGDFGAYPYVEGAAFVDALLKAHGQAALDAAFADPPVSSAQILNPTRFFYNVPGATISMPDAPDKKPVIDQGVIGQFGLFVMLRQTMGNDLAGLAASTWEGDSYVAWRDGDSTCVRARFLTESAPTAYPLSLVLKAWADQQGGGTVEVPGTVILTTCR